MSVQLHDEIQIPNHVFREYDIRGKSGSEITPTFAYLLGRAFGEKIRLAGFDEAVVGRDNRLSSPELHRALLCGFHQASCRVIDVGEVTTPMFYYALEHCDVQCGIMITASHNPGDENGFKIAMHKTTIYGDDIKKLKRTMQRIRDGEGVPRKWTWQASYTRRWDIEQPYLDMLQRKIKLGPKKLKVVVDCGNGTASPFAPKALRLWGCETIPLYCESDPSFPNHHPDPVEPHNLQDLIAKVKETGADVGLAFDGDGDRLGVVDEQGNIVWGDRLMILFWREILRKVPGSEAPVEVKCSQTLFDEIKRLGGRPFFHRTGHSHIKATMRSKRLLFAGEMSGHLFFADEYYGFDDALYAAGRLLRIMSHAQESLSGLLKDVPVRAVTPETRVPCREEDKEKIVVKVAESFRAEGHEVIDTDGARVVFPDGWGLVRCSNTQPILVLRAESDTEQGLKRIKEKLERTLQAAGQGLRIAW
jgi:phosphomannomutase/phosphoglucomutase